MRIAELGTEKDDRHDWYGEEGLPSNAAWTFLLRLLLYAWLGPEPGLAELGRLIVVAERCGGKGKKRKDCVGEGLESLHD